MIFFDQPLHGEFHFLPCGHRLIVTTRYKNRFAAGAITQIIFLWISLLAKPQRVCGDWLEQLLLVLLFSSSSSTSSQTHTHTHSLPTLPWRLTRSTSWFQCTPHCAVWARTVYNAFIAFIIRYKPEQFLVLLQPTTPKLWLSLASAICGYNCASHVFRVVEKEYMKSAKGVQLGDFFIEFNSDRLKPWTFCSENVMWVRLRHYHSFLLFKNGCQ